MTNSDKRKILADASKEGQNSSRMTRRKAISTVATASAVAAGAIIGGAAGYLAGISSVPSGAAQMVTRTITASPEVGEPVRIGVGAFLSGPFVSDGQHTVNAAQMAIDDITNAGWFMGGRKIELYTGDLGGTTPDEVRKAFEKLLLVNKVHINVAFWGSYGPGWDLTEQTGIPLVTGDTPLGATDFIKAHPGVRLVETFAPLGTGIQPRNHLNFYDWLIENSLWTPRNNPPTIYVVHGDFVWDVDWTGQYVAQAQARGWKIIGKDVVPMGTPDYGVVLAKIRAANPDIVLHADLIPADAGTFASQFAASPTKSLFDNNFGFAPPESIQVANPDSLQYVVWNGANAAIKGPMTDDFTNRYRTRFGSDPSDAAVHTYDSINIAMKAISNAGTTDPKRVYESLFQIAHRGLKGTWVFDPTAKMYIESPELVPGHIMQIQKIGGKVTQYNTVYPPEIADAKFQLPPWLQ